MKQMWQNINSCSIFAICETGLEDMSSFLFDSPLSSYRGLSLPE